MISPSPQGLHAEITQITNFLVDKSFVNDQNYPVRRDVGASTVEVSYANSLPGAVMLKQFPYSELYDYQVSGRSFNYLMLDGALIQMTYEFDGQNLLRSRLAFLPSPRLAEFQEEPELYLEDILYAEVVNKQVVAVPVRFDYDNRPGVAQPISHPRSHLTLGQFKNCRIAASAPLTPGVFMGFILRSFYTTAADQLGTGPCAVHRFATSITGDELLLPHLAIP